MPIVLTELEKLQDYAHARNIKVCAAYLASHHKGCCSVSSIGAAVMINSRVIESQPDELCTLAEEIGHIETDTILPTEDYLDPNYRKWLKRKNEILAQRQAIKTLLPEWKIRAAIGARHTSAYEMAEYCGVTEEFLLRALDYYGQKEDSL